MVAGRMRVLLLASLLLLTRGVAPVWADTVGVAVGGVGMSTPVGLTPASDGTITFYIPLRAGASGTYGVRSTPTGPYRGTSADTCSYPSTCIGGTLDMFLRFSPVQLGSNLLSLSFNDLDINGVNDPSFFLESVKIISNGNSDTFIDQTMDPGVTSANYSNQAIHVPLNIGSNPFYVQLHFSTQFASSTPAGTYRNTAETVRATVISVPEPTTLSLLGIGLAAIHIVGRRKNTQR